MWSADALEPLEFGGEWLLDSSGVNKLVHVRNRVYAAANNGSVGFGGPCTTTQQHNNNNNPHPIPHLDSNPPPRSPCRSIYVFDEVTKNLHKVLQAHSDAVRSLTSVGPRVVSGSGSRDGSVVVWEE